MRKYLVGHCPECNGLNAAAIHWDCITDADWQESRDEFEISGLIVSEIETSDRMTLTGCTDDCGRGRMRRNRV